MSCKQIQPVIGCWIKDNGTVEQVAIHYFYEKNASGEKVLDRTEYSDGDGNVIIIPNTDIVEIGLCDSNKYITHNSGCIRRTTTVLGEEVEELIPAKQVLTKLIDGTIVERYHTPGDINTEIVFNPLTDVWGDCLPRVDCGGTATGTESRSQTLFAISHNFDNTDWSGIGGTFDELSSNLLQVNENNFEDIDGNIASFPLNLTPTGNPWGRSFQIANLVETDVIISIDNLTVRIGDLTFTASAGIGTGDYAIMFSANNILLNIISPLSGFPVGVALGDGASHVGGDLNLGFNIMPTINQLLLDPLLLSFVYDNGPAAIDADGVEVIVDYTVEASVDSEKVLFVKDCNSDLAITRLTSILTNNALINSNLVTNHAELITLNTEIRDLLQLIVDDIPTLEGSLNISGNVTVGSLPDIGPGYITNVTEQGQGFIYITIDGSDPSIVGGSRLPISNFNNMTRQFVRDLGLVRFIGTAAATSGAIFWEKL